MNDFVDITFLGAVNSIGGNKFLLRDGVDEGSRLLLDFGMTFGDPKSYAEGAGIVPPTRGAFYDEFMQPRTNGGLRDLLRLGILPEVDGLYRKDWLKLETFRHVVQADQGATDFADLWVADVESYQEYKKRNGRAFVDGVLLTHAHADHFQHLAFVDPEVPVYATKTTIETVKTAWALTKGGLENEYYGYSPKMVVKQKGGAFPGAWKIATDQEAKGHRRFLPVAPYEWFQVGAFRAMALPVDHSVPGASFFLVEGKDGKRVLYTGDFRFHGVFEHLTSEAKKLLEGLAPDALLSEGTRIESDHQDREEDVYEGTRSTVKATKGLVLADWGWKDATRFLTMQRAASSAGRRLLVNAKVAYLLNRLSRVDPAFRPIEAYENVGVYFPRKRSLLYSPADYQEKWMLGYKDQWDERDKESVARYFSSEEGPRVPPETLVHWENGVRAPTVRKNPEKYVVMCSFFELNELFDLDPPQGSHYIKSSCEPFNDEMDIDQVKLGNWLEQWSIGSDLGDRDAHHHTSGHVSGQDLEGFFRLVRPKSLFPVHTLYPQRFEERFKGDVVLPKHGETVTI